MTIAMTDKHPKAGRGAGGYAIALAAATLLAITGIAAIKTKIQPGDALGGGSATSESHYRDTIVDSFVRAGVLADANELNPGK